MVESGDYHKVRKVCGGFLVIWRVTLSKRKVICSTHLLWYSVSGYEQTLQRDFLKVAMIQILGSS
jgi:hypothetical protein